MAFLETVFRLCVTTVIIVANSQINSQINLGLVNHVTMCYFSVKWEGGKV